MRLRDLGIQPGRLPTGALNAITDVPGVRVGHVTLIAGEGALREGVGPVRTGVTAILPHGGSLFREKVAAGVCSINGFGKATGFEQIRERGTIETPILLTNTLNVGRVSDALTAYMLRENPDIGLTTGTVNPVVGECNDAFLNDLRGRHVHQEHVWQAIELGGERRGRGRERRCRHGDSLLSVQGRDRHGIARGERRALHGWRAGTEQLRRSRRDDGLRRADWSTSADGLSAAAGSRLDHDGDRYRCAARRTAVIAAGNARRLRAGAHRDGWSRRQRRFRYRLFDGEPFRTRPADPVETAARFNENSRAINELFLRGGRIN